MGGGGYLFDMVWERGGGWGMFVWYGMGWDGGGVMGGVCLVYLIGGGIGKQTLMTMGGDGGGGNRVGSVPFVYLPF